MNKLMGVAISKKKSKRAAIEEGAEGKGQSSSAPASRPVAIVEVKSNVPKLGRSEGQLELTKRRRVKK